MVRIYPQNLCEQLVNKHQIFTANLPRFFKHSIGQDAGCTYKLSLDVYPDSFDCLICFASRRNLLRASPRDPQHIDGICYLWFDATLGNFLLCKKLKIDNEIKSSRFEIRLTKSEAASITASASIQNMSVSEFIRHRAHARKVDIAYENKIIFELKEFVAGMNALYVGLVERGVPPTVVDWQLLVDDVIATMKRIEK